MEDNKSAEKQVLSRQDIFRLQMNFNNNETLRNQEKLNNFKTRLQAFEEISTLEEAQKLSKSILPVSQEVNHIRIGSAKCVIINRPGMFRISLDTENEFISYDFS